jgi:alkanesulfonate monooxygenase
MMKLGFYMQMSGAHYAAWRYPSAQPERTVDFAYYRELAQRLEASAFDFLFFPDDLSGVYGTDAQEPAKKAALMRKEPHRVLEPITLLSAIAAVTSRLGLIATGNTTYNEPFLLARSLASLDHISGGRAGWNVVTGGTLSEAQNFGREVHADHAERYDRAREFVEVARGLWDSIGDGAFVRDKESGIYIDADRFRFLNHRGRHFSVRGPLNVPRPPQGHPVIAQAGASEDGRALAAQTADIVFTQQATLAGAQAFYADMKRRAREAGRSPDDIKILPGLVTFVGRTREEAEAKRQKVQSLISPEVGTLMLSAMLGEIDLSPYPVDGPLPEDLPASNGVKSRSEILRRKARDENLTIRQLYEAIASASGHQTLVGSAQEIADSMQHWFENDAADGFMLIPPIMPDTAETFTELVVPELRRRGLFRQSYEGTTLRDHLGLARPN